MMLGWVGPVVAIAIVVGALGVTVYTFYVFKSNGRRLIDREQELREGKGKSAKATVLKHTKGITWDWETLKDYQRTSATHLTKHRFTLSVAPEGEQPFEAKIVVRANHLGILPAVGLRPGKTVWVLYDPDDHSKVAFDNAAMRAELRQQFQSRPGPGRAAAAAPRGWYPDPSGAPGHRYWDGKNWSVAQPSVPAATTVPDPGSEIAKLKDLADLRDRGAITQAEFESEKAKLLGR
jgi:Protein of unknown function (DUF2510)/Short C-terminal domain